MKSIFLDIQSRLSSIVELKYIDKNWNQLRFEQPPVKFPCALLDIDNVKYTQLGNLSQTGTATLSIVVADLRLTPSSQSAPARQDSYQIFDLLDKIHQCLHGFTNGYIQPLTRVNLIKLESNQNYEVYQLDFLTGFKVQKNQDIIEVQPSLHNENGYLKIKLHIPEAY